MAPNVVPKQISFMYSTLWATSVFKAMVPDQALEIGHKVIMGYYG